MSTFGESTESCGFGNPGICTTEQDPVPQKPYDTCWRVLTVTTHVYGGPQYLQISSYATIKCVCQKTAPAKSPVDWDNVVIPGAHGTGNQSWSYKGVYVDEQGICIPTIPIMCKTPTPRYYHAGTNKSKRSNDLAVNRRMITTYHDAALAKAKIALKCITI